MCSGGVRTVAALLLTVSPLLVCGAAAAAEHGVAEQHLHAAAARRSWYVPDHAKLQFAGQIGFVAPGVGYSLADERLDLDLFFGWVPASVGGDDIYSVTSKVTYAPRAFRAAPRWRIVPLTAAIQLTYTFGNQYWLRQPGRYPHGYYDLPTAFHSGVAVGARLMHTPRPGRSGEVGLYAELVALSLMLRDWYENPRTIDATDVFSPALGMVVKF